MQLYGEMINKREEKVGPLFLAKGAALGDDALRQLPRRPQGGLLAMTTGILSSVPPFWKFRLTKGRQLTI
jgi:hypothetical protein